MSVHVCKTRSNCGDTDLQAKDDELSQHGPPGQQHTSIKLHQYTRHSKLCISESQGLHKKSSFQGQSNKTCRKPEVFAIMTDFVLRGSSSKNCKHTKKGILIAAEIKVFK